MSETILTHTVLTHIEIAIDSLSERYPANAYAESCHVRGERALQYDNTITCHLQIHGEGAE